MLKAVSGLSKINLRILISSVSSFWLPPFFHQLALHVAFKVHLAKYENNFSLNEKTEKLIKSMVQLACENGFSDHPNTPWVFKHAFF